MKDARKGVPIQSDYAYALGVATYTFARLEWQVVWCTEGLLPSTVTKAMKDEMTGGAIANRFANATRNMPASKERLELQKLAERFKRLVELRNSIAHGKPCTSPKNDQRLSGNGVIEVSDLEAAADDYADCEALLNRWFHGFLANFTPAS